MRRGTRWWKHAALLLALSPGCGQVLPRTQVMVVLDAEAGMREATRSLEIQVLGSSGREGALRTERRLQTFSGERIGWPRQVAVGPLDDDASRIFEFVGTAYDDDESAIGRVRAIGGYVEGSTLMLVLVFEDVCRDQLCTSLTTCRAAECLDATFDASELPLYDPDAVPDVSERDAGMPQPALTCAEGNGGCDPLTSCSEDEGAIVCGRCPLGYAGDGGSGCTDIDECEDGSAQCDEGVACINTRGAYRCGDCPVGYGGGGAGGCTDVDECASDNGGCDALVSCINVPGSRRCGDCPRGYDGDGESSCFDVDECETDNGGCDALSSCTNEAGGRSCGPCPAGYAGSGESGCSDVDECAVADGGCDPLAGCINEPGSFRCGGCPAGYTGTGVDGCADINECISENGGCDPLVGCTNTAGSRSCGACPGGYNGDGELGCSRQLTALAFDDLPGGISFDPTTTSYAVAIGSLVPNLELRPDAPAGTTITVDGTPVDAGQALTVPVARGATTPITVVVSEPGQPDATYVIEVTRDGAIAQQSYVKAPELANRLGSSLDLDGDRMVSGAPTVNSGAAYVFERDGGGLWQEGVALEDWDGGASFGSDVAISGNWIAVGAPRTSSSQGTVYLYQWSGSAWDPYPSSMPEALESPTIDNSSSFGSELAMIDDLLFVGQPGLDGSSGIVHVFELDAGTWVLQDSLHPVVAGFQGFGAAIDVTRTDSGGYRVLVGTPWRSATHGGAELFRYEAGVWSHELSVMPTPIVIGSEGSAEVGSAVAIDGDTLVVGAPGEQGITPGVDPESPAAGSNRNGAVYVFRLTPGGWVQEAYIKAAVVGRDSFGGALSLAGDLLLVGANAEDSAATGVNPAGGADNDDAGDSGAAYLFERIGTTWMQTDYIKASNTADGDSFGSHLVLEDETIVITAHGEDSAATGIGGDEGDDTAPESGAIYVY